MEIWLWAACGALALAVLLLVGKVYLLRKSAREIETAFGDRLTTDTNTLIDISSRDGAMRSLADAVNGQLRVLRRERQRFQQGDQELKDAVTNISHDLRTPLTAICGYLDLLEQEEKSPAAARYLAMIENRTEAMRQLTEELFRYSVLLSAPDDSRETLAVNRVLEESIASFYGALHGRGITPALSIPEAPVLRTLNRSALMRIFGNILSNAIKYSDGDLSVAMDAGGAIVFSNAAESLSPVQAGRLFDRFYTVETARDSTGLGLSIAKLLTERLGGTISADYAAGRLSVTVRFPDDPERNAP
ncbi:MAG: sensor histidine kinase [Oscillospiraceae bacterium]